MGESPYACWHKELVSPMYKHINRVSNVSAVSTW